MVDKYGTDQDPACYSDSTVLINKLNIQDESALETAEREITALCAADIEFLLPPYNLSYLRKIHKAIFQDLYAWAGEMRTVDISKGDTRFCTVNRIEPEANKLFVVLNDQNYFQGLAREKLIVVVAELYGDLNMLHPFREGNGRAQRIFFEHLVINAGFEISWQPVTQEQWLKAKTMKYVM